MRKKLITCLVFLVSFVICDLIFAQITKRTLGSWKNENLEREARIETPPYHHGLKPYADFVHYFGEWKAPFYTNSLGFRDASPRKVELKSSKPRLLFIGDSITEGVGMSYEQSFVGLIGAEVKKHGGEILNAGVQTYAYRIYYNKIKHFIDTIGLQVSEVVAFIDLGDVINESFHYKMDKNGNVVGRLGKWEYSNLKKFKLMLRDNSISYRIYRFWRDTQIEVKRRHGKGSLKAATNVFGLKWTVDDQEYDKWAKPGEVVALKYMQLLLDFLTKRGIPLTVVVYPLPDQIVARDLESRHVRFWRTWTREQDVQFINLFPVFINDRPIEEVYKENFFPYNYHFNIGGNERIAREFLKRFKSPALPRKAN